MKLILLHEILNEMYIYILKIYKFLCNSICVNGCYLQCEESHPNTMDGNDENILSSMKWTQTVNWRKVHTKSFSYMFLCKLWELVKHGTNDNSFEYVKKNSLKHARDEENKWMGQGMYFVKGFFFIKGKNKLEKKLGHLIVYINYKIFFIMWAKMKNKHWKKEGFQTQNKMWFKVYMINLFFWKCHAIQLNPPLLSITTSFFSPIGLHVYEKANLGSMLLCTICDNQLTKIN